MAVVVDTRRSRLLLVVLVLLHFAAISHQVDGGDGLSLLQRGVFALLSPLQRAMGASVRGVREVWEGYGFHRETYLARVLCAEKAMELGTNGVQLLGGHGYIKDHPVERWYRDLRAIGIMEGGLLV